MRQIVVTQLLLGSVLLWLVLEHTAGERRHRPTVVLLVAAVVVLSATLVVLVATEALEAIAKGGN